MRPTFSNCIYDPGILNRDHLPILLTLAVMSHPAQLKVDPRWKRLVYIACWSPVERPRKKPVPIGYRHWPVTAGKLADWDLASALLRGDPA